MMNDIHYFYYVKQLNLRLIKDLARKTVVLVMWRVHCIQQIISVFDGLCLHYFYSASLDSLKNVYLTKKIVILVINLTLF